VSTNVHQLILASASPYRRALLETLGAPFSAETSAIDESAVEGEGPTGLALARSNAKALDVAGRFPGSLVIGADQVLAAGDKVYSKVGTSAGATSVLRELAGRPHQIHSAFSLALRPREAPARLLHQEVVTVTMRMRPLGPDSIRSYVDSGEWRGSVGCYKIEGKGIMLFESVEGDGSTIIGLPLVRLVAALRHWGVDLLQEPNPPWTVAEG